MKFKKASRIGIVFSVIFAVLVFTAFATDKNSLETATINFKKIIEVNSLLENPNNNKILHEVGKKPEISGIPETEYFTIKSSIDDLQISSDNFYQIDMNDEKISDITLYNSQTALITKKGNDGWKLSKNDKLTMIFDIDLSVENSDKDGEFVSIGYYVDSSFVEIFYGKIKSGFEFEFISPNEGEYYIYLTNLCAGVQNYKEIKITGGKV